MRTKSKDTIAWRKRALLTISKMAEGSAVSSRIVCTKARLRSAIARRSTSHMLQTLWAFGWLQLDPTHQRVPGGDYHYIMAAPPIAFELFASVLDRQSSLTMSKASDIWMPGEPVPATPAREAVDQLEQAEPAPEPTSYGLAVSVLARAARLLINDGAHTEASQVLEALEQRLGAR